MSPEAPLFSEMPLQPRLMMALEKLGMIRPTHIQAKSYPVITNGNDVLASAETGSGKTAAFLLPLLNNMLQIPAPNRGCRALILVPTRELAQQIQRQAQQLTQFTRIQTLSITGGTPFKEQAAKLRKNPEIIIATPGRIREHLQRHSTDVNDLEYWILDEADRMLDMGFSEDVNDIAERCNKERQTLMFSATLSHEGVKHTAKQWLTSPEIIEVDAPHKAHTLIKHTYVLSDDARHKQKVLDKLLRGEWEGNRVLVFTNTKNEANRLRGVLEYHGHVVASLHGDMTQEKRQSVLLAFRQRKVKVLVATDVAARGLDIKGLDRVVHFDMARSPDDYIHRSGRTGRAGQEGYSLAFVCMSDWNNKARCERAAGTSFEKIHIKGLEAKYKGPSKVKSSGKIAGTKRKHSADGKKSGKTKVKVRARDSLNKGRPKRFGDAPKQSGETVNQSRSSKSKSKGELGEGFTPLMKKKVVKLPPN